MAFAVSGFASIAQDYISRGVASNFYNKLPFMAALGALTLGNNNKTDVLSIGRPNAGEILSARLISPAEKLKLGSVNAYHPRIQSFETSNSMWAAKYTNMPTVASPLTNAHSQATQNSATFRWAELITPILIWHEDKIRAGQEGTKEGQAITMAQIVEEATEIAYQEHVKELNDKIWNGSPTSQSSDPWDQPLGILAALSATNTYGLVSRTAEPTWQAKVVSTAMPVDIVRLLDDANLTQLARIRGAGVDACFTTPALYRQFKQQILSTNGGVILQNGIPGMAKLGVKQEVLQKDNVYIMYDPTCPAGEVHFHTMATWKLAFHPQRNMKVTKFVDLTETGEGAKDADQAFIRTRIMLSNDNPGLNVRYSSVA